MSKPTLSTSEASTRAEVLVGCNDRAQLFDAELSMRERIHTRLRKAGVTVRDRKSVV